MTCEISVGGFGALRANGLGACRVESEQSLGRRVCPSVDQCEQRRGALGVSESQENPAPLLAPLEHPCVPENLEMARDPWLALTEDLRELTDRELHQPQQGEDAQPGR